MGGMQVLQMASAYPERLFCALPIATCARYSAQNIAFDEVGRQAIMADLECEGKYLLENRVPHKGLRGGAHEGAHYLPVGRPR